MMHLKEKLYPFNPAWVFGSGNNETHIAYGIGCEYHGNCFTCPVWFKDKCPSNAYRTHYTEDREVLPYLV